MSTVTNSSIKQSGWPRGGGNAGALVRGFDWAATSMGKLEAWPQSLRTAVDIILNSPVAMVLMWGEDHVMLYNDSYAVIAAARHPHALGATVPAIWPEIWDWNRQVLEAGFRGEVLTYTDQHMVVARNGRDEDVWFDLFYTPVYDEAAVVRGVLCTVIETTARMLQDRERQQKEQRLQRINRSLAVETGFLRDLFEQAPGFMAVLRGPDHVVELANSSCQRLFHRTAVTGKPIRSVLPEVANGEKSVFDLLDHVYRSGTPYVGREQHYLLPTEHGELEERVLDFIFQPIRSVDGRVTGIFIEGSDITERCVAQEALLHLNETLELRVAEEIRKSSEAEEALRQLQKMEAVGQLTGGIAHDFNNVLQVITGNLQLLQAERNLSDQTNLRLERAVTAAGRGAKLSTQLLAFARRQPLQPVSTNPGRVLLGMQDLLRRALVETIQIDNAIDSDIWNTLIDPHQFESMIVNVVLNAADAMPDGGTLTLQARNATLPDPAWPGTDDIASGEYVVLTISDNGHGMPAHVRARAFEPFFTTKGAGSGLGLSMVYGFVHQSGGHIDIDSEPGRGTAIRIYLRRSMAADVIVHEPGDDSVRGGNETVLVVEDDASVRLTVHDTLSTLGYRVLTAVNGDDALQMLQRGIAVDMLFTDVIMPGNVRSPDLARHARELLPQVQILFTSGYAEDAIVHDGRLDSGVALLSKPYRQETLARKVRAMFDRTAPVMPDPVATPPAASYRILVVEDNLDAQHLVCELLESLGHSVEGHTNGETALTALAGGEFDVLFTDVSLPGISGVELARRARVAQPALHIVFASGYGNVVTKNAGVEAFSLPKPFDLEQLEAVLALISAAPR